MRSVRLSRTAIEQLATLLTQGALTFGPRVVEDKRAKLYHTLQVHLATHPKAKRPHRRLKLVVYPITDTPFVVLYDFDDSELRVHFIFARGASLRDLDPASAIW